MMGNDDECMSVRTADRFNYDMMVTEGSAYHGGEQELSCIELLCGTARDDEPKLSLICCTVSKRVVKNIVMFITVLMIYCFLLSVITSKQNKNASQ